MDTEMTEVEAYDRYHDGIKAVYGSYVSTSYMGKHTLETINGRRSIGEGNTIAAAYQRGASISKE